jgi:hypothetical protein
MAIDPMTLGSLKESDSIELPVSLLRGKVYLLPNDDFSSNACQRS